MKSGIYTITNLKDSKIYLGYTNNFQKRRKEHFSKLKENIHPNDHLQAAWNKYGEEAFEFEVLVEIEEEFLASEEHYWATLLNVHDRKFGYNVQKTNPYGNKKHNPETILKIKAGRNNGNRKFSEEERKTKSERLKRRGWTKEEIEKRRLKQQKPIVCLDLEGHLLYRFDSARIAGEILDIDYWYISMNVLGKSKRCNQYIFKFEKDYLT